MVTPAAQHKQRSRARQRQRCLVDMALKERLRAQRCAVNARYRAKVHLDEEKLRLMLERARMAKRRWLDRACPEKMVKIRARAHAAMLRFQNKKRAM